MISVRFTISSMAAIRHAVSVKCWTSSQHQPVYRFPVIDGSAANPSVQKSSSRDWFALEILCKVNACQSPTHRHGSTPVATPRQVRFPVDSRCHRTLVSHATFRQRV